jgi:hypothetical protein
VGRVNISIFPQAHREVELLLLGEAGNLIEFRDKICYGTVM